MPPPISGCCTRAANLSFAFPGFCVHAEGMASGPLAAVVVLVFAGASFFFALAETALFSLSKWQVRQLAEREPGAGGVVARLLAEPQDLLATMVLGNTFASAAMLAVALWMAIHGRWPLAATVVGLLALILIGCEVLPKTLAVRRPERWALRVARPHGVCVALKPAALPGGAEGQRGHSAGGRFRGRFGRNRC